jgi:hypothetical protein
MNNNTTLTVEVLRKMIEDLPGDSIVFVHVQDEDGGEVRPARSIMVEEPGQGMFVEPTIFV